MESIQFHSNETHGDYTENSFAKRKSFETFLTIRKRPFENNAIEITPSLNYQNHGTAMNVIIIRIFQR